MATFDVPGALRAGFSLDQIADFLAKEKKFDVAGAREAGFNDSAIIQELNKPEPGLGELFSRGVSRSVGELGITATDVLPALVAGTVLPKEKARPFVERQLREAAEARKELEKKYPSEYKSYKDVEDISSGAGYVAERVGELVPDILPSLGFGVVGNVAGRRMAKEAANKTAKELTEKTELELLEGGAEDIAERTAYKNVADRVGREAAEKLTREGANKGMTAGVFLGSYVQNAPEIFENIYQETGDIGASGALLFGGLSSYLDSYLPTKLLTDFGAFGKSKIMAEMLKESGAKPAVWKSVLEQGTKAALGEGLTETGQEAISVAAEKFYGSNKEFFDPENVNRYLESFFAGAAGGGVLGGVGGVSRGLQEKAIARGETGVDPTALEDIKQISEQEAQGRLAGLAPLAPGAAAPAAPAAPGLEGFDLGKVEPEKITAAQQTLKDVGDKTLTGIDANKALVKAIKSLGLPIDPKNRKTPALLTLLNTALTPIGAPDVTGTEQGTTGAGPGILGEPGSAGTAAGITAPTNVGLDVSDEGAGRAAPGAGGIPGALKTAIDQADATRAAFRDLQAANTALLGREYADAKDVLKDIEDGKIQVDPAPFQQEVALAERLAAEDDRVAVLTDKLIKPKTELQESAGAFGYMPGWVETPPVAETTETGEVVPTAPVERLVIQEDGTYGPAPTEMTGPQPAYIVDQKDGKIKIQEPDGTVRSLKKDEQATAKQTIAEAFVPNAKEFGFTTFGNLPKDQRQVFLRSLALGYSPRTAVKLTNEYRADPAQFEANYGSITDLTPKPVTKPKTIKARLDTEAAGLRKSEEASRQRAVQAATTERAIREQPVGKGEDVDPSVIEALRAGNIDAALEALFNTARDLKTHRGSESLVRAIAASLRGIGLQTKIEFGKILDSDRLAEYDPTTDTIRINKDTVLDEATLLHELVHAGTVRVIYLYDNGKLDQLTPEQIKAVEQLYTMMDFAKKRIVLPQYQKAFENIYEFMAYAITDPRFQGELAKYKSPVGRDRSILSMIVEAIVRLFDIQRAGIDAFTDKGTLASDVADVFQTILSAPDPTQRIDLAALPAKGGPTKQPKPKRTISQVQQSRQDKMEAKKPGAAMYARNIKRTFTRSGMVEFVRKVQNERAWVKAFQDFLTSTGQLISHGPGQNNLYTLLSLSAGNAKAIHQKYLYKDLAEAEGILQALVKATGKSVEKVLDKLHDYAIVLHDPERRRVKFLREAPLTNDMAETQRQKILEEVLKIDRTDPDAAKQQAQKLRADLEAVVAANLDTNSEFSKESHSKYNTLGEYDFDQIEQLRNEFKNDPNKSIIFAYLDKLKNIQDTTVVLNKEANYFSNPVNNLVDFYGFRNYFSFKGKPDSGPADFQVDPFHPKTSGELQDQQYAFEGRLSEADNPILNTINEAARASMRLGRKDVTQAIKNLVKADPKKNPDGQGLIVGKVVKTISFEDRFKDNYDSDLRRGANTIFHYNPNGSIDIIEIQDPRIRDAIKRPYRDEHPILDLANRVTSTIGQMHTRYNPAFAPVDFTRNLLTYAGIVSAEYGVKAGGDVVKQMSQVIADGGMNKTRKFSLAFANGDVAAMDKMIQEDKTGFYKDLANYFEKGGRVSYVQGLSYKDNLLEAVRGVSQNGIMKNKEQFDKFFDAWLDMFELTSRVAAYRTIKAQMTAKGMSEESADVEAIAYAKNLANFEQVGEWGKTLGTFYMFFRPAATGAVRAFEALLPAFDFSTDAEIMQRAKQMTSWGGATEAQALKYLADFKERRNNARATAMAMLGMGATVFAMAALMSGEDEEERNKTIMDDMARWVRFARFNTGIKVAGQDLVLQMPWGFGLGSLASTGAQIMAVAFGGQGPLDAANNIMDATFESFLPLPASKINKFEHPAQWAVDSITPSVLRPLLEFSMNMDGLGRQIYNNRQSRYNDAYTGGDNIPQMFKDAAAWFYNTTGADISPNTMYFFANNYLDGVSRLAATSWGVGNIMVGRKEFDPRTDTFLLDAYIKGPSNYDARQFVKVETKIKDMERDYKSLEGTDRFDAYLEKHPNDKAAIDFYNSYVNGALRDLREQANVIRRDREMNPKEKKEQLRLIVEQQNRVKSAFVTAMKGYEVEP